MPASAAMPAAMPVIGISTNVWQMPDYRVHGASERSLGAIYECASCLPLMLPAFGERYDFANLVERLDGLLLTGGASHVDPLHYSGDDDLESSQKDPARDATTLPLIRVALAAGVPILALCRGMQELNVALGGTLRTMPDKDIHSSDGKDVPLERWLVSHTHAAAVQPDGMLAALFGTTETLAINSAHSQMISQLSPKLRIEAQAPDGVIEAVSVPDAKAFTLGVQWHPEYLWGVDPKALALFTAFGTAARQRMAQRLLKQDWTARLDDERVVIGAALGN